MRVRTVFNSLKSVVLIKKLCRIYACNMHTYVVSILLMYIYACMHAWQYALNATAIHHRIIAYRSHYVCMRPFKEYSVETELWDV